MLYVFVLACNQSNILHLEDKRFFDAYSHLYRARPSVTWSVPSLVTPFVLSVVLLVLLLLLFLLLMLLLWSYDQRNCLIPLKSSVFSA